MKKLLVIGCGYVGKAAAQFYQKQNWEVTGWVRTETSANLLKSLQIQSYLADVTKEENWHALPKDFELAIYCAAGGTRSDIDLYRKVYLKGITYAAKYLNPNTPLIFTSSTSVYPQNRGEWVTETSPANPLTETGKILRAAEDVVLAREGIVLRLAGIYGPGRHRMIDRLNDTLSKGEKVENRWINHIHRDDIVTALFTLAEKKVNGIFNGCDNQPVTLYELLLWQANRSQQTLPSWAELNTKPFTHKRVSNAKLRQLTWNPKFPTYQEGYVSLTH